MIFKFSIQLSRLWKGKQIHVTNNTATNRHQNTWSYEPHGFLVYYTGPRLDRAPFFFKKSGANFFPLRTCPWSPVRLPAPRTSPRALGGKLKTESESVYSRPKVRTWISRHVRLNCTAIQTHQCQPKILGGMKVFKCQEVSFGQWYENSSTSGLPGEAFQALVAGGAEKRVLIR